jgi:hypothetical protein
MSDVVLAALIGAGEALVTALVTISAIDIHIN